MFSTALVLGWCDHLFTFLSNYPEPSGMDGYFYIKQIFTLGSRGEFYFKDYSLGFLLPSLFYQIFQDELVSYQLSVVLTMGAMAAALFLISGRLYRENPIWLRWAIGLIAFYCLMSDRSFYELSFTYLKSLTGLASFLYGFYFFIRDENLLRENFFGNLHKRKNFFLSLLFFILAILSHKTTFILIGLGAVSFARPNKKFMLYSALGGALGLLLFAVLFSSGWHYLAFLVNQLQMPQEMIPWISWLYKNQNWVFCGLLFGPLALVGIWFEKEFLPRRGYIFLFLLFLVAWFPFFKQNLEAPSYRLMLLQFSVSPALFVLLCLGRKRLAPLALIVVLVLSYQWQRGKNFHAYFKGYSKMDWEVKGLEAFVAPTDHLTCHHGLEFYVDYKTNIRCRSFLSQKPEQKKFRLVTVSLERGPWSAARIQLNQDAIMRLGDDYFLVTEEYWLTLREKYHLPDTWRNPMAVRPAHIYE